MTATTSEVCVRRPDGETETHQGVLFAQRGVDPKTGVPGVVMQLRQSQPDDPGTVFIEHGEILFAYDEIANEDVQKEFLEYVQEEPPLPPYDVEDGGIIRHNVSKLAVYALTELQNGNLDAVEDRLREMKSYVEEHDGEPPEGPKK